MATTRLVKTEIMHNDGKKRDIFEITREDGSTYIYEEISDYTASCGPCRGLSPFSIYEEISDYTAPPEPDDELKREIADLKSMVTQLMSTISTASTNVETIKSTTLKTIDSKEV